MRLGEERIVHLSQKILKGMIRNGIVEPLVPEEKIFREIKRVMTAFLEEEDEVDELVRRKIRSHSRPIPEGSAEWNVLYRKYKDEEMRRRNKV